MIKPILQLLETVCLCFLLLAACGPANPPAPTAAMEFSADTYQPLARLLAPSQTGRTVVTAGYYYLANGDATLVDGLSFGSTVVQPFTAQPAQQIWLGGAPDTVLKSALHSNGDRQYALVSAIGRLEGPGAYGPQGSYAYQLVDAHLTPLTPLDLTVPAVLSKAFTYDSQFVRVSGTLLARNDSALLVDSVGPGGLPPPAAHQIKLAQPFRDQALWNHLPGNAGGLVRYGPVQVEGFWRAGVLHAFGIMPGRTDGGAATPTQ